MIFSIFQVQIQNKVQIPLLPKKAISAAMALAGGLMLCACSNLRPDATNVPINVPVQWYVPTLAHEGQVAKLSQWWQQFNDPILSKWIDAAQMHSATLTAAQVQFEQANAAREQALSALLPTVTGSGLATRGRVSAGVPVSNLTQAGFSASWILDIWGQSKAYLDATQGNMEGARAAWHNARVLVAAETAMQYFSLKLCLAQQAVTKQDSQSREETARLNAITERAGFTAPAVSALAQAASFEAKNRLAQQQATCEAQIKTIVGLTAIADPQIRADIQVAGIRAPNSDFLSALLQVPKVPANLLLQRPDVYRAQRDLAMQAANVGIARMQLLPSLTLAGQWLHNRQSVSGLGASSFNTWSAGPLQINLPIFNRASLQANAQLALANYDLSFKQYQQSVRTAVSEVEKALVKVDSMKERVESARMAAKNYEKSLKAVESKYKVGMASLTELEEARRYYLSAQSQFLASEFEHISSVIDLYVALGGGFDPQVLEQDMQTYQQQQKSLQTTTNP